MTKYREMAFNISDWISNLVFGVPQTCALCGSDLSAPCPMAANAHGPSSQNMGICRQCLDGLRVSMQRICAVCGIPIIGSLRICVDCRSSMGFFDAQRSAGIYRGNLSRCVRRLKYGGERWLSGPLGHLLAESARAFLPLDLVVPVPIDPGSLNQRGLTRPGTWPGRFPSALGFLWGTSCSGRSGVNTKRGLAGAIGGGISGGTMAAETRAELTGLRVLVVDDVMTTGATLDEAARALKGAGALVVYGGTVARTSRE